MIPEVARVEDVAARAVELFVDALLAAVRERGRFATALPGGSTPLPAYRALARRKDLPWDRVHVFVGDERFVPPTHPDSNFRALRTTLLDHVPIPPDQVHPWPIEAQPQASADAYADAVEAALRGRPFDLTLLGLGADGHTAGIFPGTGAARARGPTVASSPEATDHPRLSLSPLRLSESRIVAFLVSGAAKRDALRALLADEGDHDRWPCRAISALERLVAVTDLDAAG